MAIWVCILEKKPPFIPYREKVTSTQRKWVTRTPPAAFNGFSFLVNGWGGEKLPSQVHDTHYTNPTAPDNQVRVDQLGEPYDP